MVAIFGLGIRVGLIRVGFLSLSVAQSKMLHVRLPLLNPIPRNKLHQFLSAPPPLPQAAMKDSSYVYEYVKEVMERSKPMFEKFLEKRGIGYWPTVANFIFCYFPDPPRLEEGLQVATTRAPFFYLAIFLFFFGWWGTPKDRPWNNQPWRPRCARGASWSGPRRMPTTWWGSE